LALVLGLRLTAAFCAGRPTPKSSRRTLKKIKETGRSPSAPRLVDSIFLSRRQPEADRLCDDICYRIVDAVKKELKLDKLWSNSNPVTSSTAFHCWPTAPSIFECGSTTNNADRQKQVCLPSF